ncbi:MAG: sodium:solute symporter family protein [Bacteroidota bacterium]
MHWIDITIFVLYMIVMLGVGFFFHKKNKDVDDYFVGGRTMGSWHIGLSVVATDVGGGFSIGLGGLGFAIGLSGSWMLFTGLIGAWLAAVILIPRIKKISEKRNMFTFPQVFEVLFNRRVAFFAGLISAIGYIGFTSSQLLAGAKLASATFPEISLSNALLLMGFIAISYTVMGGLKAVIYTDTIQWIVLIGGLMFVGLPFGYFAIGGLDSIRASLPQEFIRLDNLTWQTLLNWFVTIIPIWFVGMTLYQRIYATRDTKTAKKAWFIAGIFEYPFMAFMGVLLGMFARVAFNQGMFMQLGYDNMEDFDPEMGLPLLLRNVLPFGVMGLLLSAYFSAILSTADSCLMAASGNVLTDLLDKIKKKPRWMNNSLSLSKWLTLFIGVSALLIALKMETVLDLMLYSYAFMVSGLLVPLLGGLFLKKKYPMAAIPAMILGGFTTVFFIESDISLPLNLEPNIFGIMVSAGTYLGIHFIIKYNERHHKRVMRNVKKIH